MCEYAQSNSLLSPKNTCTLSLIVFSNPQLDAHPKTLNLSASVHNVTMYADKWRKTPLDSSFPCFIDVTGHLYAYTAFSFLQFDILQCGNGKNVTHFDIDTTEMKFKMRITEILLYLQNCSQRQTELQIPGNVTFNSVCSMHRFWSCTAATNNTMVKVSRLRRKRYLKHSIAGWLKA